MTASRGVGNDELEVIEPFDLGALVRYVPAIVSGLDLRGAASSSRARTRGA